MASKKMNFEQSLARLEEIVQKLENGELMLSDSLKLFEEGTELISACTKMLDEAEQKVVILKQGENGAPTERPFGDES